jgi:hypothetical protein
MHKLIPLLLLFASAESAQTQDNRNYSQTFPIRVNQQTPGTCQMWEFFIDSTDGHTYECWLPNSWGNLVALNFPRGATASLPTTCNVGDPFIVTDATSTDQLYICTATNTWTQQTGSGGVSYQGTVVPGAPVVAVSSSKIQSLTASTTCTTGFTGLYPATCATVVLTGQNAQVEVDNAVVPCGGSICPAGLYRVNLYEWVTSGNCGPSDVNIGWTDTSRAQTYDLTGGAYQTTGNGVGAYVGSVSYLYSTGAQNITYTLLPGSVVLAATTTLNSIHITLERLE